MQETWVWSWLRKMPWRRKWQPTPVFSPGKSHGQKNLAGYSPWGRKSQTWFSDKTTTIQFYLYPKKYLKCVHNMPLRISWIKICSFWLYFWCFWTVLMEKTLESPLDCKEIQPVHPKGDQSWIYIGRTDAEAETPILWPSDVKNWLIGKDPDAGKDWKHEEKGTTEDEMVGWHHQLNGHEFE